MGKKPEISPTFRLPAAVLRYWVDADGSDPGLAEAELFRLTRGKSGFHRVTPGTLAITAESGDPAVFDTALHLGQRVAEAANAAGTLLKLLVLPGEVRIEKGKPWPMKDRLVEHAPTTFPDLPPGIVHVTGWVLRMLELPRQATETSAVGHSSKQRPPLFRTGKRQAEVTPWRNAEILNRKIKGVPRRALESAGSDLLNSPAWRIEGPVGCGKSRLAHRILVQAKMPRVWLHCEPRHRASGSLVRQILDQLEVTVSDPGGARLLPLARSTDVLDLASALDDDDGIEALARLLAGIASSLGSSFYLVIDDLELCDPADLRLITEILSLQEIGRTSRLLLIGRSAAELSPELAALPALEVPPLNATEMGELSPQLFSGLSLPATTQERLLEATQGCPFALEEAMVALIREQSLKRVYGGFFFAGQDSTEFSPSPRLLSHLQAEVFRAGIEIPALLLSLVEGGVPAEVLNRASAALGSSPTRDWDTTGRVSGLLASADTPWGRGVDFASPVFGATLAFGIDPASIQHLRLTLGGILAAASDEGDALWESYRLLRGTAAATGPLLKALRTSYAVRIPRETLIEILSQELFRHRERQGDSEIELQILWKLLPLARKLGRLNEFTDDLDRGVELATGQPNRLLALAGLKAEMDQDAGRYAEAETTIRMALEAAKGTDQRRQALLLIQLGRLQLDQERYDEAKQLFQKLSESLDRSGLTALSASCLYYLGNIAFHEEHFEEALDLHHEALSRRRAQKLERMAGNSLTALGSVYLSLGNYPQALSCYGEARELLERNGSEADRSFPLLGLGRVLARLGDYTAASRSLREALALRQGRDDLAGEAIARLAVAENHFYLDQLNRAQEEATKAHFQLNLLSRRALLADAEQLLGRIQIRLRQHESAQRHLEVALELHQQKGNRRSVAFSLAHLVRLALLEAQDEKVIHLTSALQQEVEALSRPELEEQLHFQLYKSFQWLRDRGESMADPRSFLESSYRELLRKASHLDPELRNQFLFQIAEYRDIVEEAAKAGLTTEVEG